MRVASPVIEKLERAGVSGDTMRKAKQSVSR
jgi:hypothetical protein